MVIGEMVGLANQRMLGFDLEMLADAYQQMWVDFFHTRKDATLHNCVQMYIIGLAMDKFDSNRSEDMRAGAVMFASDIGFTVQQFQDAVEKELRTINKKD